MLHLENMPGISSFPSLTSSLGQLTYCDAQTRKVHS